MVEKGMEIALRTNKNKITTILVNGYGVAFISEKTKRMIVSTYWAEKAGIKLQTRGHFANIYA